MIPISNCMQKQPKKKELIGTNNKGEEQEETVNFFSYCLLLVQLCNPSFPAAMPSEIATMISGRPTHIDKKEIETLYCMTTPDLAIRKHGDSYKCMF